MSTHAGASTTPTGTRAPGTRKLMTLGMCRDPLHRPLVKAGAAGRGTSPAGRNLPRTCAWQLTPHQEPHGRALVIPLHGRLTLTARAVAGTTPTGTRAPGTPPSGAPTPPPAIERAAEVHLHFHGVTAEDVAAIVRQTYPFPG